MTGLVSGACGSVIIAGQIKTVRKKKDRGRERETHKDLNVGAASQEKVKGPLPFNSSWVATAGGGGAVVAE